MEMEVHNMFMCRFMVRFIVRLTLLASRNLFFLQTALTYCLLRNSSNYDIINK